MIDEIGIRLVEKLILLVIAAHQQPQVLTTRSEGPIVSGNALQGVIDGLRVSTGAQQRLGLFQGQLHDKIRKRASAGKPKRASPDGATGAANKHDRQGKRGEDISAAMRRTLFVRETVRQRENGPEKKKRP